MLEHPTPLCRRQDLPHSKITCATLIIPIIPLFYKGNLHGLVCFRAVQGIYIPAQLFCSPRRCPRGPGMSHPLGPLCWGTYGTQAYLFYTEENTMRKALIYGLSLALVFSLSACTPTQEDAPEDTSTPEFTEPADTSTPEQTAPTEPDDQELQETAETTETPVAETPTHEEVTEPPAQQTSTPPQQAQSDTDSQTTPSSSSNNSGSQTSQGSSGGQQSSGSQSSSGGQSQTQQPSTSGGNSYRDTAIPPEMQSQPENWMEEGTGGSAAGHEWNGEYIDKGEMWEGIQ